MYKQITHKQHYVWREYLKSWGHIKGRKTFVWWNNKNNILFTDLFDILREKDFYQFKPLNQLELFCLKELFTRTKNTPVKKVNKSLDIFIDVVLKIDSIIDKKEEFYNYLIQIGEDIQSKVEKSGLYPLKLLKNENLVLFSYDDDGIMIDFIVFIIFQYLRTKGIKEKVVNTLETNDYELKELYKKQINSEIDYSLDWNKVYNYGLLYIANQVAYSMVAKQVRIRLMKTNNIKFIVSDQPVYNIADDKINNFDLFYPITPELAIIISSKYKKNEIITIEDAEVNYYNINTIKNAHNYIIGYEKSYIEFDWKKI